MDVFEADFYRFAYIEIIQHDPGPDWYEDEAIRIHVIIIVDAFLREIEATKAAQAHRQEDQTKSRPKRPRSRGMGM